MINELFVLSRKKIIKFLILLIIICTGLTLMQLKPSKDYDNFYNTYSNQLELFEKDESFLLIPVTDEGEYIYYQLKYLVNRNDEVDMNIDMLERKITSSLFKDDLNKLNHELTFEKIKENAEVEFYNTYLNEKILNNNLYIYCLYIIGIILVISIFYDDIKNGQLQIYKTYKHNLKNIFISKFFSYVAIIFVCMIAFMLVEMILIDGNYSVYNMVSFSGIFTDLNLLSFTVCKYINTFINTILLSIIILIVLLTTRNLVVTMIGLFLGFLMSFFAFATTMSNLKYFNLYYLLFVDKLEFNGINAVLNITKISLCVVLVILGYLIYVNDFYFGTFKNRKSIIVKSTNVNFHTLRELLIKSKGILAITIALLFSIYQINTFKMSSDYREVSYQQYKSTYIGTISHSKYDEILTEYQIVKENYDKYLKLEELVNQNPEQSLLIFQENEEIVNKAQNMDNIQRLKNEYEEAMDIGLDNFVDNRGANLLLMKDQVIYLIECISILMIPLILVYISFRKQLTQPSYSTVIKTSKIGEKKYLLYSDILFITLTILNTITMIVGHIIKIKKYYLIDLSYTLKDILFVNAGLSLSTTLFVFGVAIVLVIVIASKTSFLVMHSISSNKKK